MAATANNKQPAALRWWWPVIGVLTAVALVMRIAGAHESPAGDELYFLALIKGRSLGGMLQAVVDQEKTPPLGFLLGWAAAKLGPADTWMRAPSVVAGTALVPVCALLARRAFTAAAGIAAAQLVALSPFLLFYGVESRSYALCALFVALSALFLLEALKTDEKWRWAGWMLCALAALLSHYTAVFAIGAEIVWAIWTQRERRRSVIGWSAGIALLFAAWLPFFFVQFGHAGDEARRIAISSPLNLDTISGIIGRALVGHPLGATSGAISYSKIPGTIGLVLVLGGMAIAVLANLTRAAQRPQGTLGRPKDSTVLLIAMTLAVPAGLILASLIPDRSLLLSRNLISALPPLAVLVGSLLTRPKKPLAITATVFVALGLSIGSWRELVDFPRPAMRAAADAINQRFQPGDLILEAMYFTGPPLDRDLWIHLGASEKRALILTRDAGLRPFDRDLPLGSSVFTVTPAAGYSTGVLAPAGASAGRYRLVWSERWRGYTPVFVAQWQKIK